MVWETVWVGELLPSLKPIFWSLKVDGWMIIFLFGMTEFSGALAVSFRACAVIIRIYPNKINDLRNESFLCIILNDKYTYKVGPHQSEVG